MSQYYVETYGCQMNVADSELVAGIMEREGYVRTGLVTDANIIFINTCSIREHAEKKIYSRLGVLKKLKREKPELLLGILGCMAQHLKNDLLEKKSYVDFVLGPDSYRRIPEMLHFRKEHQDSFIDTRLSRYEVYDNLFPSREEGINAWISIMRGCDKFCTFCVVPFTRGRERSKSVDNIIHEITKAINAGFVEITLLGQNVNSYRYGDVCFSDLLDIVARIPGVLRVRFTSPHPQDVDDRLLFTIRDISTICKSIHLPLQAGANRILQRMNRTYTQVQYLSLVERIRQFIPGCSITTDIMVGFPGETRQEFKETLKVLDIVRFDQAFTFKYSSRPGTKAAEYSDQVPEGEKQDRLIELVDVQKKHTLLNNLREVGKIVDVLIEKVSKKSQNMWAGRTDSNKWVVFPKENTNIKECVKVKVTAAHGVTLFGQLEQNLERVDACV